MSIAPGFCLKLLKSVYGLKQASRLFHELLVPFLLTLGIVANPNDTCVMYLGTGRSILPSMLMTCCCSRPPQS
jgi:hypothetical protein